MSTNTSPNSLVLPPSGHGHSRETAQWSHALLGKPDQPAYIVHASLSPPVTWRICTKAEALYYQESGYAMWRVFDGRKVVFEKDVMSDSSMPFVDQFVEVVGEE
ncbi:hypothetical protein C7974DRAFT_442221 [Boeremia exigua]|uniref:uncharacterized protein n=1 Tax=Boeremia exigua TaxID=749465 RepID=UPI001E8E1B22|nr:uncharacterized protein C7974DRAFT_442221 [Boeremia exigua]KAH6616490.1 hypothetical protein C7974DRAFT_442221 [Boeremia exigua]